MAGWDKEKVKAYREAFSDFVKHLEIDSKETGVGTLELYGAQYRFLDEVFEGLANDIHWFVVLKARQLGISTITRALQVFWCFMHPGLRLALVYDRDDHKEEARAEIKRFLDGLPMTHRLEATKHDRYICEFSNGSRLSYFVAGIKKSASSGGLGRGRGINACGATEVSSWADIEGLRAFERSLAEQYPDRLYIFESTARGLNIFYDLWQEARADDLTKKAIFIGWWAKEIYSINRESPLFARYGVEPPTDEEQEKIDDVEKRYNYKVGQEQLAWYRHQTDPNVEAKSKDSANSDDIKMQELPWTEDEAFLSTGSAFFPGDKLTEAMKNATRLTPKGYRYVMADDFFATTIEPVKLARHATLKIWEEPNPDGIYAIGCDPAGGSSEEADRYAIQIIRCYADGVDQVAEFTQTVMASHQFAWVIAHLCGAYNNARLLLELNGPGFAVLTAFRELELLIRGGYLRQEAIERGMTDILSNVRHYVWSGMDSMHQDPTAFHWRTSTKLKLMIMNRMNDFFSLGQLKVRSLDALQEMEKIVREGDSVYGEGQSKDDRVIALALACHAWERSERKRLIAQERTRLNEERRANLTPQDMYAMFNERMVGTFFDRQHHDRVMAQRQAKRGHRWNW